MLFVQVHFVRIASYDVVGYLMLLLILLLTFIKGKAISKNFFA